MIQAEHRDEQVAKDHRDEEHHEVDQEREQPPGQHAAKQLRLRQGIEGMRRHLAARCARRRRRCCPNCGKSCRSSRVHSRDRTWEPASVRARVRLHINWRQSCGGLPAFVIPGRCEASNYGAQLRTGESREFPDVQLHI